MPTLPFSAASQIALAAVLAGVAFYLLLPKPRRRSVAGGVAAGIAALAVFALWLAPAPNPDAIATALFWLFSVVALVFGTVLVAQRNPARGAIAFAFVILSTCGLFLLLAAPFLMAATIIVYAGAIIVTFLFVLMLSQTNGPSDENDRTREPLLGSLAGFAFVGLVLFCLHRQAGVVNAADATVSSLPAVVLNDTERTQLADAVTRLDQLIHDLPTLDLNDAVTAEGLPDRFDAAAAPAVTAARQSALRLRGLRDDAQAQNVTARNEQFQRLVRSTRRSLQETLDGGRPLDAATVTKVVTQVRDEARLVYGAGELPARNVANLGTLIYSKYLLSVELAGSLLLVATIGAVAIAGRKEEA